MRQFCSYLAEFAFCVISEIANSHDITIIELTKSTKVGLRHGLSFKPKEKFTAFEAPLFFCQFYLHASLMLVNGRLERTEINLMHFKWEVT